MGLQPRAQPHGANTTNSARAPLRVFELVAENGDAVNGAAVGKVLLKFLRRDRVVYLPHNVYDEGARGSGAGERQSRDGRQKLAEAGVARTFPT